MLSCMLLQQQHGLGAAPVAVLPAHLALASSVMAALMLAAVGSCMEWNQLQLTSCKPFRRMLIAHELEALVVGRKT
jgi:hypothetical protein